MENSEETSWQPGRYIVIHKLGYGLSSTIWLTRDGTLNKYVAIKILTAETPKIRNELGCLEYLSSKPRSKHPGQKYVSASFLDRHFWLDGPNGRHLVLVSKVSGPSIQKMTDWAIRIRESLARKIALQVTQGLAYLHSEGICHGNLTSSDVLFQLADFDSWSQEKVYEQLGIPSVLDLDEWSQEPCPRYVVDSAQFFRASPGLLTENIRIIDYGDSFRVRWSNNLSIDQGNPLWPKYLGLSKESMVSGFGPPENICGLKPARSSDLWALGCIIFEIRAGSPLFPTSIKASPSDALWEINTDLFGSDPYDPPRPKLDGDGYPDLSGKSRVPDNPAKEKICQFVAEIEVEPREGGNNFDQTRPYIKSDLNLFWKPQPISCLYRPGDETEDEIEAEVEMWKGEKPSPKISSTEAEQLSNLLSLVLSYLPEERKSAASLAKHPWFVEPVRLEASCNGKSHKGKSC